MHPLQDPTRSRQEINLKIKLETVNSKLPPWPRDLIGQRWYPSYRQGLSCPGLFLSPRVYRTAPAQSWVLQRAFDRTVSPSHMTVTNPQMPLPPLTCCRPSLGHSRANLLGQSQINSWGHVADATGHRKSTPAPPPCPRRQRQLKHASSECFQATTS